MDFHVTCKATEYNAGRKNQTGTSQSQTFSALHHCGVFTESFMDISYFLLLTLKMWFTGIYTLSVALKYISNSYRPSHDVFFGKVVLKFLESSE